MNTLTVQFWYTCKYISLQIKNIPLHSNKDLYQQKDIDVRQLEHFNSLLEDWECKFFSDLTFLPVQLHTYFTKVMFFHRS